MARFTSRRKSFRSGKPKRKLHWITYGIEDRNVIFRAELDTGNDLTYEDAYKRTSLFSGLDMQAHEVLSEKATLIRVVSQLSVRMTHHIIEADTSLTWVTNLPCFASICLGKQEDWVEYPIKDLPSVAVPYFDDPQYFLQNDVLRHDVFNLSSSGSATTNAFTVVEAHQELVSGMHHKVALSSKCKRKLDQDSLVYVDWGPLSHVTLSQSNDMEYFNVYGHSSAPNLLRVQLALTGTVRFLVAI